MNQDIEELIKQAEKSVEHKYVSRGMVNTSGKPKRLTKKFYRNLDNYIKDFKTRVLKQIEQ